MKCMLESEIKVKPEFIYILVKMNSFKFENINNMWFNNNNSNYFFLDDDKFVVEFSLWMLCISQVAKG